MFISSLKDDEVVRGVYQKIYGMYRKPRLSRQGAFRRPTPYSRTRKAYRRSYGQRPRYLAPRSSLKYYDQTESIISNVGLSGAGACLNDMVQGTAVFDRIGNKVKMCYLQYLGYISLADSFSTGNVDMWRICIYLDRQTSGEGLIATTDMYYDVPANSVDTLSHRNPYNMQRFKVLRDIKRWIGPQTFAADIPYSSTDVVQDIPTGYIIQGIIPLKDTLVTYNAANNGNSMDINTNALNYFAYTNGIDENGIQVLTMRFRLCYYDC